MSPKRGRLGRWMITRMMHDDHMRVVDRGKDRLYLKRQEETTLSIIAINKT